ncbi:MAG: aminotransferase class I/II-fold pyridoxal phosphate-dependent enzyme [Pseudomonadales bacterium]|nr:aminotransferase class I/II-fold pyridoxal phosphate-dependent enzyme [Pseudomonadales bacterium]
MSLLARANELAGCGNPVIHLEVGEPDFDTPQPIAEAGIQAICDGITRYTDAQGDPELRQAICDFYGKVAGIEINPSRVFITAGASGGLLLLTALLINPGENLLMTDPGYPCNRHFLSSFNAEGLLVPVSAENNYQRTPGLVDQHWTENTRGILVASPANPTGAVLSRDDIEGLLEALNRRRGFVISDEIYQGLVYQNLLYQDQDAPSALSVTQDALIVNSFSKYFGMTGWRLGWVVVPETLVQDLAKLAQNLFICPSAISQRAAIAAFSSDALDIMQSQRKALQARRDYLVSELKTLGFGIGEIPAGAFYVYARLPDGSPRAVDFCSRLLEEEYVAITPGTDFGFHEAGDHVRISYARDISELELAVERIGAFLT